MTSLRVPVEGSVARSLTAELNSFCRERRVRAARKVSLQERVSPGLAFKLQVSTRGSCDIDLQMDDSWKLPEGNELWASFSELDASGTSVIRSCVFSGRMRPPLLREEGKLHLRLSLQKAKLYSLIFEFKPGPVYNDLGFIPLPYQSSVDVEEDWSLQAVNASQKIIHG